MRVDLGFRGAGVDSPAVGSRRWIGVAKAIHRAHLEGMVAAAEWTERVAGGTGGESAAIHAADKGCCGDVAAERKGRCLVAIRVGWRGIDAGIRDNNLRKRRGYADKEVGIS